MGAHLMLDDILKDISIPDMECALSSWLPENSPGQKDLFEEKKRKAWDKSMEARCDFARHIAMTRRSSVFFITIWKKSVMGRTLTEIKADEEMVPRFAEEVSALIKEVIGDSLERGQWAMITTPKRRHLTKNFATRISERMADILHIPFYEDVCSCKTKQRVNAEFIVNIVPPEPNIICFDDFVTTGQTLAAMKRALDPHHKNIIFFAGINNIL